MEKGGGRVKVECLGSRIFLRGGGQSLSGAQKILRRKTKEKGRFMGNKDRAELVEGNACSEPRIHLGPNFERDKNGGRGLEEGPRFAEKLQGGGEGSIAWWFQPKLLLEKKREEGSEECVRRYFN